MWLSVSGIFVQSEQAERKLIVVIMQSFKITQPETL